MEILKPGQSATLSLPAADGPASSWRAIPDGLVTLTPAADGMSCQVSAVAGQVGQCTVKAFQGRNVAGLFSVKLEPAKPAIASAEAPPHPTASASVPTPTSTTPAAPAS